MRFFTGVAILFLALMASPVIGQTGGADASWADIQLLDQGPQVKFASREDALRKSSAHMERQIISLRRFIAAFPADPRLFEARMKLAAVQIAFARLSNDEKSLLAARKTLLDLSADPTLTEEQKSNVAYALLSLDMQANGAAGLTPSALERIHEQIMEFSTRFPGDRRIAALFAELASAYAGDPKRQLKLLKRAQGLTKIPEISARIADDLARIARIGHPLEMRFKSMSGLDVDVARYSGRVVVIVFWAGWSLPAMAAMKEVVRVSESYPPAEVQFLGISLDGNRDELNRFLAERKITWPVYFDGKSWESPLVRSLGINSLPSVWILDASGRVTSVSGQKDLEGSIRRALGSPR